MKQIIRCAIYTRKSTEEGLEQDFNSLQAQREACEAYIASQKHEGWQLIKTHYDDGGFSGGNMQRPALQQLMDDIAARKINVVVVYKVDRLTRSLSDFAKIVEGFDAQGVSFVSVTQQFNTTSSMGRLTLNVLLSFAQFEREVTGERIRDKIAASKKKGMWMGGVLSLGYDVVDRKLVINKAEAETVCMMYRRYLELGSVRALQEEMVRKNIRSKTRKQPTRPGGNFMTRGAIYKLLSNPIYIGQIRHKEHVYPGQHEPIMDQALWDQVQQHLAANAVEHKHRTITTSPLAGKLFDASGDMLKIRSCRKHGRRYRYYVSDTLLTSTRARAQEGWRLPAQEIEHTILQAVQNLLGDRALLTNALREAGLAALHIGAVLHAAKEMRSKSDETFKLVERAEIQKASITLRLAFKSIAASPATITHEIPMQMKRCGVEMRLVIDGGQPARTDETLIKTIARAHVWSQEFLSGKACSLSEIAARHKVSVSYVKKLMPLAFLSPDVVEAVVAGQQPADLTAQKLIRGIDIPFDWKAQKEALGF